MHLHILCRFSWVDQWLHPNPISYTIKHVILFLTYKSNSRHTLIPVSSVQILLVYNQNYLIPVLKLFLVILLVDLVFFFLNGQWTVIYPLLLAEPLKIPFPIAFLLFSVKSKANTSEEHINDHGRRACGTLNSH